MNPRASPGPEFRSKLRGIKPRSSASSANWGIVPPPPVGGFGDTQTAIAEAADSCFRSSASAEELLASPKRLREGIVSARGSYGEFDHTLSSANQQLINNPDTK